MSRCRGVIGKGDKGDMSPPGNSHAEKNFSGFLVNTLSEWLLA